MNTGDLLPALRRILERMYDIAESQSHGLSTDTLQSTNRAELTEIIRQLEAKSDDLESAQQSGERK